MKIYTKTGDHGQTGILGKTRVDKDDTRINAYGTIDELSALLGKCYHYKVVEQLYKSVEFIQNLLFEVGTELAYEEYKPFITEDDVTKIEIYIDSSENQLPPLKSFILSSGSEASVHFQILRTVCRRAERKLVTFSKTHKINEFTLAFVNRLSDLFFSWARLSNHMLNIKEIEWTQRG